MDSTVSRALQNLRNLKAGHTQVCKMLAGHIYGLDLLAMTVLNRSLGLVFGFASLIEQKNFIAAAPLLRFQLDNILRFYASTRVERPHYFALEVLAGKSIRDMKDSVGKRLTDDYLLRTFVADSRLDDADIDRSWIESVYKGTSGYVHLSDKHMHNCLAIHDDLFCMTLSEVDRFVPEEIYIEAIEAMASATNLTLQLVYFWMQQKKNSGNPSLID